MKFDMHHWKKNIENNLLKETITLYMLQCKSVQMIKYPVGNNQIDQYYIILANKETGLCVVSAACCIFWAEKGDWLG